MCDDEDDRPLRSIVWSRLKTWWRRTFRRKPKSVPHDPARAASVAKINETLRALYLPERLAARADRPHPLFAHLMSRPGQPTVVDHARAQNAADLARKTAESDAGAFLDGANTHDEYKRRNRQRWEAMRDATIAEFDDEKVREALRRSFARFDEEEAS